MSDFIFLLILSSVLILSLILNITDKLREADIFTQEGKDKIKNAGYEKLTAQRYRSWTGAGAGGFGTFNTREIKREKIPLLAKDIKTATNVLVDSHDEIMLYGIKNGKKKLLNTYSANEEIARQLDGLIKEYNEGKSCEV